MRKLAEYLEMSEAEVRQGLLGCGCAIISLIGLALTIFIGMLF